MDGQLENSYQADRVPAQCRNGPIPQRSCTDFYCFVIYIILLASVISLAIISAKDPKLTQTQVQTKLSNANFGTSLLAIYKGYAAIIIALACVILLGFLLMVLTFTIPQISTYIYIPVTLLLMLLMGAAFIYRYLGQKFPFISDYTQDNLIKQKSSIALVLGILFLVGFLITLITIVCKKQKFKNILPVLKMARICFWQNCYLFFLALFLSIISIVLIQANILLLEISQRNKDRQLINNTILTALIILEILFTHGFIQSLSDFLFQSIAIEWYFNEKKLGADYSKCSSNCSASINLAVKHIGTIAWGSIYAYIPEFINSWLGTCERTTPGCYKICCCVHKASCRKISRYSHTMTILQNFGFFPANTQMFSLKQRTKAILPQIYLMGSFYSTILKILIVLCGIVVCFQILVQTNSNIFSNMQNIIPPLIVVILVSSEIATHFTNCGGLVGDTISFMYNVDLQIEKVHFGELQPLSCPPDVKTIIQSVKLGERVPDY